MAQRYSWATWDRPPSQVRYEDPANEVTAAWSSKVTAWMVRVPSTGLMQFAVGRKPLYPTWSASAVSARGTVPTVNGWPSAKVRKVRL